MDASRRLRESLAPDLAPIPLWLAEHLARHLLRKPHGPRGRPRGITIPDEAERIEQRLTREIEALVPHIRKASQDVYTYMVKQGVPEGQRLNTNWLLLAIQHFTPLEKVIYRQRVVDMLQADILRKVGHDLFNAQSVAWVLTARAVDDRINGWVPAGGRNAPAQPRSAWSCLRIPAPGLSPVPYTLFLRENGDFDSSDQVIPPAEEGLYYTHWEGGRWIRGWTGVEAGAMHLVSRDKLTYELLTRWDPSLPGRIPAGSAIARNTDVLVEDVLQHLSPPVLSRPTMGG